MKTKFEIILVFGIVVMITGVAGLLMYADLQSKNAKDGPLGHGNQPEQKAEVIDVRVTNILSREQGGDALGGAIIGGAIAGKTGAIAGAVIGSSQREINVESYFYCGFTAKTSSGKLVFVDTDIANKDCTLLRAGDQVVIDQFRGAIRWKQK